MWKIFWRFGLKNILLGCTFYILAQFIGGFLGIVLVSAFIKRAIASPAMNYVVTIPGFSGILPAFMAEAVLSFLLMLTIQIVQYIRTGRAMQQDVHPRGTL